MPLRGIVITDHLRESFSVGYHLARNVSQRILHFGNMRRIASSHGVELATRRWCNREILHELDDATFTAVMLRVSRKFHV